jgi:hypothetical protein
MTRTHVYHPKWELWRRHIASTICSTVGGSVNTSRTPAQQNLHSAYLIPRNCFCFKQRPVHSLSTCQPFSRVHTKQHPTFPIETPKRGGKCAHSALCDLCCGHHPPCTFIDQMQN